MLDAFGHIPRERACVSCGIGPRTQTLHIPGVQPMPVCDECCPNEQRRAATPIGRPFKEGDARTVAAGRKGGRATGPTKARNMKGKTRVKPGDTTGTKERTIW